MAALVVKVKAQSVAAETLRKVSGNKVTGFTACQGQDGGGSQYYLYTLSTQCLQYYLKFWPINLILKDLGEKLLNYSLKVSIVLLSKISWTTGVSRYTS